MFKAGSRTVTLLWWASPACLIGGGALWALSPVGIELSTLKFKSPDVFWKLFLSSPALLFLGLSGLYVLRGDGRGPAARIGLLAALAGLLLVVAGDVGLYHLGVDDTFIVAAPAYRVFRVGLLLLSAGALLFGAAETRGGGFRVWAGLPFAFSALSGLLAVWRDLGPFGAALWAVFGAGWVWLGLSLIVESFRETDGAARAARPQTEGRGAAGRAAG